MSAFDLDRIGGRQFLDSLISEVMAAGQDALRLFAAGAGSRAKRKPDRSPVTEADEAVEVRLRAFLARERPDAAFLGEETGESAAASTGLRFIVDPIDGTRAFVRGLETWAVLVGLEADGEPVLGVALLPALRDLFVGFTGGGAYKNGRPLRVSSIERLSDAAVAHGALSQFTESGPVGLLEGLAEWTYTQRGVADFYGHTLVMEGRCDAMVDPGVKPWDLCAVMPMIRESGGVFTDLAGAATIYGGSAVASNGIIHDELITLIQGKAR